MSDSKKHLEKIWDIPLYRGKLVVLVTEDRDRVIGLTDQSLWAGGKQIYAHSIYGNYEGTQGFFIVLNPYGDYRNVTFGTVTHEAVHTSHFIMEERGISASLTEDEPMAYLAEWIADRVWETLKEAGIEF